MAAAKGYFEQAGLNVSIVQPPEDGATAICAAGQVLRELPQRRFLAEYRSRSCLIGKTVELTKDVGTVKKVAVLEIADDCGLVVRDSFGNVETLHAGEVHIGAKGLQG